MSSAWGPAQANSRLQAGHAQLGVRPSSDSTTQPPSTSSPRSAAASNASGDGNPMTNGTAGAPGQSGHRGARRRLTSRPGRQALALS
jgi:hypothetical protein